LALCRSRTRVHASVSEFPAAKKPDVPGCLVLDVRMPGISGLDFQEKLSGLGIPSALPSVAAADVISRERA
jgi:FixJ family two-component response regulator